MSSFRSRSGGRRPRAGRLGLPCQHQPPSGPGGRGAPGASRSLAQGAGLCQAGAGAARSLPGAAPASLSSRAPGVRLPPAPAGCLCSECPVLPPPPGPSSASRLGASTPPWHGGCPQTLQVWTGGWCPEHGHKYRGYDGAKDLATCLGPSSVMTFSEVMGAPPAGHSLSHPRTPPPRALHLRTSRRGLRSGSALAFQERSQPSLCGTARGGERCDTRRCTIRCSDRTRQEPGPLPRLWQPGLSPSSHCLWHPARDLLPLPALHCGGLGSKAQRPLGNR